MYSHALPSHSAFPNRVSSAGSSMAQNQYMTTAVFEHFFDAHTKSLRGEFRRIDEKFDAVGKRIDDLSLEMNERFGAVDRRFDAVDQRLDAVDRRFDAVDQRFDTLEYRMSQNEARARNYRLTRLHQRIQRITVVDTTSLGQGTVKEPVNFPATVKDFWNLRKKPGSLVYLLRFYNLSGWKGWGSYASDLESSDSDCENAPSCASSPSKDSCPQKLSPPSASSQPPQTLEDAVEAHPELALQELAEEFGLDYDRIESTVQAYKTYHAKHALVRGPSKRSTPPILTRESFSKRQRQQPRPSPPVQIMSFTVEDEEARQQREENPPPRSEPSVHTQLGWAVTSEEFEEKRREFYERSRIQRPKAPQDQPSHVPPPSGSQEITLSS